MQALSGDKPPCSHLHAQESGVCSDVNCGPEPCQSGTELTFPILCPAYTVQARLVSQIDCAVRAYAHGDHSLSYEFKI